MAAYGEGAYGEGAYGVGVVEATGPVNDNLSDRTQLIFNTPTFSVGPVSNIGATKEVSLEESLYGTGFSNAVDRTMWWGYQPQTDSGSAKITLPTGVGMRAVVLIDWEGGDNPQFYAYTYDGGDVEFFAQQGATIVFMVASPPGTDMDYSFTVTAPPGVDPDNPGMEIYSRTGDVVSAGNFYATAYVVESRAASVEGSGSFSATVSFIESAPERTASFTGSGDFSATVRVIHSRAGILTSAGDFTATRTLVDAPLSRQANLTGVGNFAATRVVIGGEPEEGDYGGIIRWRFQDTATGASVVVPLNPREMSTPTEPRNMQWAYGPGTGLKGQDLGGAPTEWTFTGLLLTESHYDLLLAWTKTLHILRVTDHLERTFEIIIQKFDPIERQRAAYRPWRADYTMTCLLLRRIP